MAVYHHFESAQAAWEAFRAGAGVFGGWAPHYLPTQYPGFAEIEPAVDAANKAAMEEEARQWGGADFSGGLGMLSCEVTATSVGEEEEAPSEKTLRYGQGRTYCEGRFYADGRGAVEVGVCPSAILYGPGDYLAVAASMEARLLAARIPFIQWRPLGLRRGMEDRPLTAFPTMVAASLRQQRAATAKWLEEMSQGAEAAGDMEVTRVIEANTQAQADAAYDCWHLTESSSGATTSTGICQGPPHGPVIDPETGITVTVAPDSWVVSWCREHAADFDLPVSEMAVAIDDAASYAAIRAWVRAGCPGVQQ